MDGIIAFVICGPPDRQNASLGFVGLFRTVSDAERHARLGAGGGQKT